jgi:hypothetical protein
MKAPAFQYDPDYYLLISVLNVKQQDYFMQIIDIIRYNKKELGYRGFVYKKKTRQEFYWVMPKRHLQTDKCDYNLTVRSTNTIVGHRIYLFIFCTTSVSKTATLLFEMAILSYLAIYPIHPLPFNTYKTKSLFSLKIIPFSAIYP